MKCARAATVQGMTRELCGGLALACWLFACGGSAPAATNAGDTAGGEGASESDELLDKAVDNIVRVDAEKGCGFMSGQTRE